MNGFVLDDLAENERWPAIRTTFGWRVLSGTSTITITITATNHSNISHYWQIYSPHAWYIICLRNDWWDLRAWEKEMQLKNNWAWILIITAAAAMATLHNNGHISYISYIGYAGYIGAGCGCCGGGGGHILIYRTQYSQWYTTTIDSIDSSPLNATAAQQPSNHNL